MKEYLKLRDPIIEPAKQDGATETTPEEKEKNSLEFPIPSTMQPYWIHKATGTRSSEDSEGAFLEYFAPGTEPNSGAVGGGESATSYLEMPGL